MSAPGAEFPPPMCEADKRRLVQNAQDLLNAKVQVCAVCDRFVLYKKDISDFPESSLPPSFYTRLTPPDGTNPLCPALPVALRAQYDVSQFFSGVTAVSMSTLLLSPRAFLTSESKQDSPPGVVSLSPCTPEVPVCVDCIRSLKVKRKTPKPPKFFHCYLFLAWAVTPTPARLFSRRYQVLHCSFPCR